jgi:Mor family transcriptional regulator
MRYKNARDILPPELLEALQRHITGELLYIPQREGEKLRWGQLSGTRREVKERNDAIRREFRGGASLLELAKAHCLSEASIKKIVYSKQTG